MWNIGVWLVFLLLGCGVEGLSLLSVPLWRELRGLAVFALPFFVEVVPSLGLLLVAFVFSVVGCCSFWYFGVASLLFIAGA